MTNADKFKNIFELYATELWSMPEKDFLKWLNSEAMNCSEIPNSSDTISRQAAVDALQDRYKLYSWDDGGAQKAEIGAIIREIYDMPSAQPEIIRCKDCKHWTQTTGNMRGFGLGDCDYINAKLVNCNGFCYWAERRTDEGD